MSHSGSCTGKKWAVEFKQISEEKAELCIIEKFGVSEAVIFSTSCIGKKEFGEKWLRPQRCVDLLEDFLASHPTFNYESHALKVLGKTLRRPIVFEKKQ